MGHQNKGLRKFVRATRRKLYLLDITEVKPVITQYLLTPAHDLHKIKPINVLLLLRKGHKSTHP